MLVSAVDRPWPKFVVAAGVLNELIMLRDSVTLPVAEEAAAGHRPSCQRACQLSASSVSVSVPLPRERADTTFHPALLLVSSARVGIR